MRKNLITVMILAGGVAHLVAADAPKPTWETSAALGLTLTKGNSDTVLGTLSLDTKRKWEQDEVAGGIAAGYGEAEVAGVDTKNTEFVRGFGQYNRLFTERLYAGLRLDGEYDGIAGVDYRFRISPLAGYYLVKNEKTTLAVEAGPSFVFEELEGQDADSYVALRIGERFEHKLSKTTRIWQSAEYLPDISDWQENYLINAEIGIDTAITPKLSLRTVLQNNYVSQPSAGREHNDIRLITGVAYKF